MENDVKKILSKLENHDANFSELLHTLKNQSEKFVVITEKLDGHGEIISGLTEGVQYNSRHIDSLANIVLNGFEHMGERFDRLDGASILLRINCIKT